MQGIYNCKPGTNHFSRVYIVAAVLYLQFVLHLMLLCPWNMFYTFTLGPSSFSSSSSSSSSSYYYYYYYYYYYALSLNTNTIIVIIIATVMNCVFFKSYDKHKLCVTWYIYINKYNVCRVEYLWHVVLASHSTSILSFNVRVIMNARRNS
jgi:hypothetical protein